MTSRPRRITSYNVCYTKLLRGQYTYFASDIAYHADKFARGFERVVDVWGADHHGYIPRVRGALEALGLEADRLAVALVQRNNFV